jgi:hypothetical protein
MASRAIQQAIVDLLQADAALAALLPDGVYMERGPDGATRFAVVALLHGQNERVFGARAIEHGLYLVKAVTLGATEVNEAAEARIDEVLENAVLMVAGYAPMMFSQEEPIRETEPDSEDASIVWYHGGGQYQVDMST